MQLYVLNKYIYKKHTAVQAWCGSAVSIIVYTLSCVMCSEWCTVWPVLLAPEWVTIRDFKQQNPCHAYNTCFKPIVPLNKQLMAIVAGLRINNNNKKKDSIMYIVINNLFIPDIRLLLICSIFEVTLHNWTIPKTINYTYYNDDFTWQASYFLRNRFVFIKKYTWPHTYFHIVFIIKYRFCW